MIYFTKCENLLPFFARSGKILEIILCTETLQLPHFSLENPSCVKEDMSVISFCH